MFFYTTLFVTFEKLSGSGYKTDGLEILGARSVVSLLRDKDDRLLSPFIRQLSKSKTRMEQIKSAKNWSPVSGRKLRVLLKTLSAPGAFLGRISVSQYESPFKEMG